MLKSKKMLSNFPKIQKVSKSLEKGQHFLDLTNVKAACDWI